MKTAHLYLIKCGKFYKIGWAFDPQKRKREFQIGNPIELEVIWSQPAGNWHEAKESEKKVHNVFKNRHVRGEWYKLTRKDLLTFGEAGQ